MRGRFESLVCSAQAARDLFETYLSKDDGSPEKQEARDRLFKVLKTTKRTYRDLFKSLKQAVKEDE
jgi:hypothetical protein